MRVLGIDPGSRVAGWAILENRGSENRLVAGGNLRLGESDPLPDRLRKLREAIAAVIAEHAPELGAVESVFSGANPQSLIRLSHARGVVLEAMASARLPIREFTPQQVKSAVVGYGRAEKVQVQRMVGVLVIGAGKLPRDAADAAAVALAALASRGVERAVLLAEAGIPRRKG
jgi:crossover junction endodeoxyribonuclease RuvC